MTGQRRERPLGAVLQRRFLPVIVACASIIVWGAAVIRAETIADSRRLSVDAPALLVAAAVAVPFDIVRPTELRIGYELENVEWTVPSRISGQTASTLDLWYSDAGGNRIHVWQTDVKAFGDTDPLAGGRALRLGSVDWRVVDPWLGPQGKQIAVFTARLNDGTTISIDGPFESTYMYGMVEALVTE